MGFIRFKKFKRFDIELLKPFKQLKQIQYYENSLYRFWQYALKSRIV